jgi:hypothetical protein
MLQATHVRKTGLMALALLCILGAPATAAVINVPGGQPTIAAALAAANPGDQILVAPGTYVITSTLNASTANVTLQGSGVGSSIVQVASGVGYMMIVNGAGFTLRDFTIQKTDLPNQNMILIGANNVTVRDNEIYGPDPGTTWTIAGFISRALEVQGGLTGLNVQGNNIHHLRQPAYVNPGTVGTITNNVVSRTKGWVVDGATLAFSGNTWGPPQNESADIALLASCTSLQYPNLLALSSNNGDAYISGQFAGSSSGRADSYVDASAAPGGDGSSVAPYQTVQAGVNGTLPGGTVHVAAGTYTEQVIVSGKSLTIAGAGAGATTIQAPAAVATLFSTGSGPIKPVVGADGAANVVVQNLKIDGMGNGNANNRLVGLAYWNSGGTASNLVITRVRNNPLDGVQAGVGVYAFNNTGGPYSLTLTSLVVNDFQKNAYVLAGTGLTVSVTGGSITGAGNTNTIAQNGIQISSGAGGTVNGTAIANLRYNTPASAVAAGILVFGPGPSVAVSNLTGANRFQGVQIPVYFIDASGSVNGAEVDATSSDQGAIFFVNNSVSALKTPKTEGVRSMPPVSPDEVGDDNALLAHGGPTMNSSLSFSVSNACLTGSGSPNTQGVYAYSAGGPVAASVNNCTISSWTQGLYADGAAVSLTANDNSISGNGTGYDNTNSLAPQNAERNWWGSASGPSGTGPGSGDAIAGANVDFNPWRTSGADLSPACGFQPDPDNQVTPGPAPSCIAAGNACITIPVVINRTDSANLRLYSVDFQLSANLVLCSTPGASITQGPYLATGAGINGTSFQVVSNGGGSYTVDQAILGLPCGATGSGGIIFNISVKAAGGGDGTGTITVTGVTLRDCLNGAIASSAGAPVNITIDQTPPAAIAALAAQQVKVGNDGDGTTKITLTWPAVPAGSTVSVYRAKFGNYPEYDDPPTPGSVPVAPSYPPGAPWVLTGVTTSGSTDEVTNRDFWYYVAFVKDGCNNVSAVSNRTNGTLNYHLGDVTNGFVAGTGNNLVDTADISLLGANYGIFGAPVASVAYLDVGPTTDFSVNARPTTDDRVNFEDLIMFAINYGTVSAPGSIPDDRVFAGTDRLSLSTTGSVAVGDVLTTRLQLSGSGRIQGLSTRLSWNPRAVEPIGYDAGALLSGANGVVFSPAPGTVDAALLGVRDRGLSGDGDVATVRFKVLAAIDPEIAIAEVTARDAANQPVSLGGSAGTQDALPKATLLMPPVPNPTTRVSALAFSLAHAGRVDLAIYSVDGRKVRTLVAEQREAGFHSITWNGMRDDGARAPAGVYFARMLTADGGKQTRVVTILGQ